MQNNNKYEVLGEVGEGAYGIVLKCRNKETGEILAIKTFKDTEDEIVQKSMFRELKVLKTLKHDNIVQLRECYKKSKKFYLVFEYVEKTLLEMIELSPNGLDQSMIKNYIYQLCKAVNYIHNLDLIHRDIKPENILIKNDGIVKLCDFGFCRNMPQKGGILTDYVATRWYRAPELLLGSTNYGKEVDHWAIGCLMGELIDGQPMFPGDNELNQLVLIQKLLGSLPQYQLDIFYANPRFAGYKFESFVKPESLDRRYYGKLNKVGLNFLKQLLKLDPKERLTGQEVLMHAYFDDVRQNDPEFAPQINATKVKKSTTSTIQPKVAAETRTNKFQTIKNNFYVNNGENNYSKSPPKDHNPLNQPMPKGKSNPKKIISIDPSSINMHQNNIKTFYNIKGKDDDMYGYNIDTNFELNRDPLGNIGNGNLNLNLNLNNKQQIEVKKISNNTKTIFNQGAIATVTLNQNLDVIEEDSETVKAVVANNNQNSYNNLLLNQDFDKKVSIKNDYHTKTFYNVNKYKPDTGADFYEDEYIPGNYKSHNSPPKNMVNNIVSLKKGDNFNNIAKMTYHGKNFYQQKDESPETRFDVRGGGVGNIGSSNANFLPQISLRNHENLDVFNIYSKKMNKNVYQK